MEQTAQLWVGEELSDDGFVAFARGVLARGDVTLLPGVLVFAERHAAVWATEAGQALVVDMLALLLEAFDLGEAAAALTAMHACPPALAAQAHDLYVQVLSGGSGELGDPAARDDAALLTLAVLLGASGRTEDVAPFLERAREGRVASHFGPPADAIVARYAPAPAEAAFQCKLIVWDLDDTLWRGTLADGEVPVPDDTRADFVRAFNRHGIVSAICSKNDFAAARAALEGFGLWDEFVFPRIAFVPKGAVIKQLIADMQLRPQNVLFIDDNPHNLHEVAAVVPGIRTVDATSPECDALLTQLLADNADVEKSRVADYRLLESKVAARAATPLGDEAFLQASDIQATFTDRMDNLAFAERIEELINRSNQLNYTQSRAAPGSIRERILNIDHYEVLCAFVWDKYGYYGLVGAAVYAFRTKTLEHFAFSCRIMHMGVEDAMIRMLAERGYPLAASPAFKKPLPAQSGRAITVLSYADPDVRARVLAEEAPRDWNRVYLRIMADCQSGAFHHYSRFRDEADFDNNPRLFSLPQMVTGAYRDQHFPRYLVYTAATDYIDWRWTEYTPEVDVTIFRDSADKFVELVVSGDRRCLLFLPPQGLSPDMYELHVGCVPERSRALHPVLNDYWRDVARRHPDHFTLVELKAVLATEDYVHAHHYVPSALQKMAGIIDDWYAAQQESPVAAAA